MQYIKYYNAKSNTYLWVNKNINTLDFDDYLQIPSKNIDIDGVYLSPQSTRQIAIYRDPFTNQLKIINRDFHNT